MTVQPSQLWIYPYAENSGLYRVEKVQGQTVQLRRPRKRVDAIRFVTVEDLLLDGRVCQP